MMFNIKNTNQIQNTVYHLIGLSQDQCLKNDSEETVISFSPDFKNNWDYKKKSIGTPQKNTNYVILYYGQYDKKDWFLTNNIKLTDQQISSLLDSSTFKPQIRVEFDLIDTFTVEKDIKYNYHSNINTNDSQLQNLGHQLPFGMYEHIKPGLDLTDPQNKYNTIIFFKEFYSQK